MKWSAWLGRCALLAALSLPAPAVLAEQAPEVLVKEVTSELIEIVRTDPALKAGDGARARELVREKVLPHFDFRRMTMLAVGRDWREASQAQQAALIEAFRDLLVRTYSNALTQYSNETIDYKPARYAPTDKRVQIKTEVRQPGAQPVGIDYMLERGNQGWKVFDVIVAGVSLVTNYRSSFAKEINQSGIDGLVALLESRNRELAAGSQP